MFYASIAEDPRYRLNALEVIRRVLAANQKSAHSPDIANGTLPCLVNSRSIPVTSTC